MAAVSGARIVARVLKEEGVAQPSPKLGEHTKETVTFWLGLDRDEVETLQSSGCI